MLRRWSLTEAGPWGLDQWERIGIVGVAGSVLRLLETCLAYSGHGTPFLREALMSDAAVFQGRRRKRADLAEQWRAEIPVATQSQWLRTRAEAAVLEARGDVRGALGKLAEVEAAVTAIPNQSQRDTLLRSLQRWKLDLGRCLDV